MSQTPDSPSLSAAQLATLKEIGEERTANAGDVLYRVGDRDYPFVAIIEGEVAVLDAAGNEIARHGASKFLGAVNLLSGRSLFVTAVAREPLRYIAVERMPCARCCSMTGRSAICDAPRPLKRERWSCSSSMRTSRETAQRSDSELRHSSHTSNDFPTESTPPSKGGNRQ